MEQQQKIKAKRLTDTESGLATWFEIFLPPYGSIRKCVPKSIIKDEKIPEWFLKKMGLNSEADIVTE